jgi:predicted TIM-barrel fold metal-dependent hydrolase
VDYPYVEGRIYTLPDDGLRMLRTLGMERVVLVQPSIYGTDNSRMLDGSTGNKKAHPRLYNGG